MGHTCKTHIQFGEYKFGKMITYSKCNIFHQEQIFSTKNVLSRNPHIFRLAEISQPTHINAKWNKYVLLDTADLILKPLVH